MLDDLKSIAEDCVNFIANCERNFASMPSKKQTEVLLKTAVCAVVAGIVTIAVSAPLAPIVAGTVGIGTFFYLTKDYGYVNQARDFVTSAVRSVRR